MRSLLSAARSRPSANLVWRIEDRMVLRNAQSHDLVLPNSEGKPDGHFLRKLKAIAMKAGVEGAELHRLRKTYADTLHEEGVSVNTIRIRLGHESLDVTLAYLKGKDAESEEARSTPTAAAWRCTHKVRTSTTGDF